jgi:putative copper resistance protein D
MRRHHWIASSVLWLWVGVVLVGGLAFGGTPDPGKEAYQKRCQSCHGPDGKGNPKMAETLKTEIQDLTIPAVWGKMEAELLKTIADGKGKMPPFGKMLNEQDRRAILSYLTQLATGAH